MARGKRKGKNSSYPVGHPLHQHQESTSRPLEQDGRKKRHNAGFSGAKQISSPGKNEMPVENLENISLPSSSARKVVETPIFRDNSDDLAAPNSSAELVTESQTAYALSDEKATDDFSNLKQITTGLPVKLTPGNRGRKIRLISNLYPIALLPGGNIFHYDVRITKWKADELSDLSDENNKDNKYGSKNTRLNREVIQNMLDNNVHFCNSFAVFDGKYNLYTPSLLQLEFPFETKVFLENESKNPEHMRVFKVQIKPVKKKNAHGMKANNCALNLAVLHELYGGNMTDVDDIQEALTALETIFRHSPALRYVPIGRNFYHLDIGGMHPLSGGIQIWFGYHQSLRLGEWKPMVNLNTCATTFFNKQTLIDYVANSHNIERELPCLAIEKLARELRNVKIETYHLGYKAKRCILDMTKKSAERLEFELKSASGETRTVTVLQYFHETYNINLMYPHLPCVQVKPKEKYIYLPLEVCNIPEGEHCRKELSIDDKRKMIQCTADPPVKKFNKISSIRNKWANYNDDEYFNSFGIRVESNPERLVGRVLEAPKLNYNKNKTIQPTSGSWNLKNLEFWEGANISSWTLISLAPEKWCSLRDLENFSRQLQQIGKAAGLIIGEPKSIKIVRGFDNDEKLYKAREELKAIQQKRIQLTIIVIPNKDKFLYVNVKQAAEVKLGLLTQCIDHNNVKRCNASLLSNLCLKINAKMGGINHILTEREIPQIMSKPVMVMGADVCHAGVTDTTGISIASVTGSLDMILSRFAVMCRPQKNPQRKSVEIILELKDMVKTLLECFYRHTGGQRPEKIIFFRDGVSDTQFNEIKTKEVRAIREACMELEKDKGYQPAITFVTVQKRHHVRLRPEDSREGIGPEGNVPPGTVVDTDIVHPAHSDFYLCSHQGLKGTSRPAHYTVLEDDSEFSANDLQKLIYYSCTISFRCSKTISIPVPVHYADLAAYRTRLRLSTLSEDLKRRQTRSGVVLQEIRDATELADLVKNTMYFV